MSEWSTASLTPCGLPVWSEPPGLHGNAPGFPQAHPHGIWLGITQSGGRAMGVVMDGLGSRRGAEVNNGQPGLGL